MRPTGKLHLGNYMGALHNWVRLQHEYDCYFFIADWHALTTDYADPSQVRQNTLDVALDWAAKMPIMRYGTVEVRPVREGMPWQTAMG